MSQWWISRGDGKTEGPLSTEALVQGLVAGMIPKRAHVCRVGDQKWVRVSEIDEIWEAANPEQIRTNITEQPWFLNHPDSGQHRLADADADDERTQVLTPLPMVTTEGGNHAFGTPLPRPGTHRELLARQVAPTHKNNPVPPVVATPIEARAPQSRPDSPIRAKVPTLDGISDLSPPHTSNDPPTERQRAKSPLAKATLPRVPEKTEALSAHTAPLPQSKEGKQPDLVPSPPPAKGHQVPDLGPLPIPAVRPGFAAPSGLAPFGAIKPLPTAAGIPSPQSPLGHASTQPISPTPNRHPQPPLSHSQSLGERALSAEARPGLSSLPKLEPLAAEPRSGLPVERLPAPTRSPIAASGPSTGAAIQSVPTATPSPSLPAPSLTQPRPLNFGPGLPPALRPQKPNAQGGNVGPIAKVETAAEQRHLPVGPAAEDTGLEFELELTEENELTAIAQKSDSLTQSFESSSDDELTTIAHQSPAQTDARLLGRPPPHVSDAAIDDEPTSIVSAMELPSGGRSAVTPTASDASEDDSTILFRKQRHPEPPIPSTPAFSHSRADLPKPLPVEAREILAPPTAGPSLVGISSPSSSLVSNPEDLLEEGDDEPVAAPPQTNHLFKLAPRPNAEAKLAPVTSAAIAISPPSAPPPARRPRLPSAPSIVLRPEPMIHQEATQPAVRAIRRPGTVQLSYGTLLVVILAIALIALTVAYVFLRHA